MRRLLHPVAPILLLALTLRLWSLGNQPVLYFDSGQYLGEARFLATAAQQAVGGLFGGGLEQMVEAAAGGTAGHAPDNAKVGHAILLAGSFLVLGQTTFAATLVSALAGIATVAATYAIGAIGWGRRVAIPAALLLAISGQHLVYSREPYAEADTVLFATLGCLVYIRALVTSDRSGRSLFVTGVLFGLAFSCNTRASYVPLLVVPTELLAWRDSGWRCWRSFVRRGVVLSIGFLTPLAAIEAGYLLARLLGRAFNVPTTWPDYVQQVLRYWHEHPVTLVWDQWPTYLVDLALMDGLPVLGLVLAGAAWLVVRKGARTRADVFLLTCFFVPLLLYSVYVAGDVRLRAFSIAMPWVMLGAAFGLQAISLGLQHLRNAPWMMIMVGFSVLVSASRVLDIITAPTGMPGLMSYLAHHHITDLASTDGPVLSFYVGEDHTNAKFRAAYVDTPEDLATLSTQYQYLAVDMQGYLFPGEIPDRYVATPAVFAAPHGSGTWYLASILEHRGIAWGEWQALLNDWQRYREAATQLRLEDLRVLARG